MYMYVVKNFLHHWSLGKNMGVILFYLFVFFLVAISSFKLLKKTPQQKVSLPPGSMGWPYLGETLQLFSQNPNLFFSTRLKRHGEIVKTHILGCPCVMLASPEAVRFVLVTQAHLFKPTYPPSKEQLIGRWALFFHAGPYHLQMRKLVQWSLSLDIIRSLVPDIGALAVTCLESWSGGHVVNVFRGMKKLSFDVAVLAVFGNLDAWYKEKLKENYFILDKGYNSFPTSLPGTSFSKSASARRRLGKILSDIVNKRKEKRLVQKDFLGCLLNFRDENGQTLTDVQIADNMMGVLFAAQDTTASMLTWILKYIHDDPKILAAIMSEQMDIYKSNNGGNRPLTWAQTRNMAVTHKVIMESLRMASIISFTYREAIDDIHYNGYLIPRGWKVLPLFRNIHHNPDFFSNPYKFDPSRFEVGLKPNTFMPFGTGVHSCPGNELAKLEMLIFIHHAVTKFRWEVVGSKSTGIQYSPFPVPEQGLPAKFWKESGGQ